MDVLHQQTLVSGVKTTSREKGKINSVTLFITVRADVVMIFKFLGLTS